MMWNGHQATSDISSLHLDFFAMAGSNKNVHLPIILQRLIYCVVGCDLTVEVEVLFNGGGYLLVDVDKPFDRHARVGHDVLQVNLAASSGADQHNTHARTRSGRSV